MKKVKYFIFLAMISFCVIGNVYADGEKIGVVTLSEKQENVRYGQEQLTVKTEASNESWTSITASSGHIIFQVSSEDMELPSQERRTYVSFRVETPTGKTDAAKYWIGGQENTKKAIETSGNYRFDFTFSECAINASSPTGLLQKSMVFDWDGDSQIDQTVNMTFDLKNITLLDINGDTLFDGQNFNGIGGVGGIGASGEADESISEPTSTNKSCKVEKEVYYNKEGKPVTKAEWEKSCGEKITNVPDTGVDSSIYILALGVITMILGGTVIYKNRRA